MSDAGGHDHVERPGPAELRDPLIRHELKRASVWFGLGLAIHLTTQLNDLLIQAQRKSFEARSALVAIEQAIASAVTMMLRLKG